MTDPALMLADEPPGEPLRAEVDLLVAEFTDDLRPALVIAAIRSCRHDLGDHAPAAAIAGRARARLRHLAAHLPQTSRFRSDGPSPIRHPPQQDR